MAGDLHARCPNCGGTWLVAKLPMDLRKVARLAAKAACANGCDAKPVLAPTTATGKGE